MVKVRPSPRAVGLVIVYTSKHCHLPVGACKGTYVDKHTHLPTSKVTLRGVLYSKMFQITDVIYQLLKC